MFTHTLQDEEEKKERNFNIFKKKNPLQLALSNYEGINLGEGADKTSPHLTYQFSYIL